MPFVPGLAHTTGYNPASVWPQYGYAQQFAPNFGYAPQFNPNFGFAPQFAPQAFLAAQGLGHSTGYAPAIAPQFAQNAYNPFFAQNAGHALPVQPTWPIGAQNVAAPQGWIPGMSHTNGYNQPVSPYTNQAVPFTNQVAPFTPALQSAPFGNAWANSPWTNNVGLNHTTGDMTDYSRMSFGVSAMDPYGVSRLIQTFPFAQYNTTPVL